MGTSLLGNRRRHQHLLDFEFSVPHAKDALNQIPFRRSKVLISKIKVLGQGDIMFNEFQSLHFDKIGLAMVSYYLEHLNKGHEGG